MLENRDGHSLACLKTYALGTGADSRSMVDRLWHRMQAQSHDRLLEAVSKPSVATAFFGKSMSAKQILTVFFLATPPAFRFLT